MVSRKSHRKHKSHRRRHSRKEGGAALNGAPLSYQLAGDWSSKMSMGHGADVMKFRPGMQGGALLAGTPLNESQALIPSAARGAAMLGGLDKAFQGIAGLKDQAGGKRRKHSRRKHSRRKSSKRSKKHGGKRRKHTRKHSSRRKHSRRHSKKNGGKRRSRRNRSRRSKGGALGYAPVSAGAMLLGASDYAKAGLNTDSGVELAAARARSAM